MIADLKKQVQVSLGVIGAQQLTIASHWDLMTADVVINKTEKRNTG